MFWRVSIVGRFQYTGRTGSSDEERRREIRIRNYRSRLLRCRWGIRSRKPRIAVELRSGFLCRGRNVLRRLGAGRMDG